MAFPGSCLVALAQSTNTVSVENVVMGCTWLFFCGNPTGSLGGVSSSRASSSEVSTNSSLLVFLSVFLSCTGCSMCSLSSSSSSSSREIAIFSFLLVGSGDSCTTLGSADFFVVVDISVEDDCVLDSGDVFDLSTFSWSSSSSSSSQGPTRTFFSLNTSKISLR